MTKIAPESSGHISRASIESIRSQADDLLGLLDESGLVEAAALMATAIDAIDAGLRRLPASTTSPNDLVN